MGVPTGRASGGMWLSGLSQAQLDGHSEFAVSGHDVADGRAGLGYQPQAHTSSLNNSRWSSIIIRFANTDLPHPGGGDWNGKTTMRPQQGSKQKNKKKPRTTRTKARSKKGEAHVGNGNGAHRSAKADGEQPDAADILRVRRTAYAFVEDGACVYDFWAFRPRHDYIFAPTGRHYPMAAIDSIFPSVEIYGADGKPLLDDDGEPQTMKASKWLDRERHVDELTWAPGKPYILQDVLATEGGLIPRPGNNTFNSYRPPRVEPGDASKVTAWLNLVKTIYPNDSDHLIAWMAHRVQRPEEKINHALVLGGTPGIGKDSMLAPLRYAVRAWNFAEVSPTQLLDRFNPFVRSVVLRVSEARDLGDVNRYALYDHMKVYSAAPPETLRCNDKYTPAHHVLNVCGVIITSNYKVDGIFLPADDRRHFVCWSDMI